MYIHTLFPDAQHIYFPSYCALMDLPSLELFSVIAQMKTSLFFHSVYCIHSSLTLHLTHFP